MNIIGIQWSDSGTCAAIKDNKVLCSIAEERFTKIKNDMSFPLNSLKYCLKQFKDQDIDFVAVASKEFDYVTMLTQFFRLPLKDHITLQSEYYYPLFYKKKKKDLIQILKKHWKTDQYPKKYWKNVNKKKIKTFSNDVTNIIAQAAGVEKSKVIHIDHHKCHANYAYYSSPFKKEKCLVFTIDGSGDRGINASIFIGNDGRLEKFYETKNCIIGRIYSHITLMLGMRRLEHEYKLMGLAPYGINKIDKDVYNVFNECLKLNGFKFEFNKKPKDCFIHFQKRLQGKRFDIIASALQKWVENIISKWIINTIKIKKINKIAISGGVSMNAKAMGHLLNLKEIKSLWVPGVGNDDSLCIGAPMEVHKSKNKFFDLKSLFLGNDADLDEKKFIDKLKSNKRFKIINYSHSKASKFLSKGKIFGRCVGKMEFGARSLGNRSILADPRNIENKNKINSMIKKRDFWMPFAPTVLDTFSKKYLEKVNKSKSYHMSLTYRTTNLGFKNLKAACHEADKTVRAQILEKETNSDYYKLISAFKDITKCGALLNTSFNLHGYPVVQNLEDALNVINNSDLDGLITKNYIILKS